MSRGGSGSAGTSDDGCDGRPATPNPGRRCHGVIVRAYDVTDVAGHAAQVLADLWTRENGRGAKEIRVRFGEDAWPATGARLVRNAAGALHHVILVVCVLGDDAVDAPCDRQLAARRDVRRQRDDCGLRPFARDAHDLGLLLGAMFGLGLLFRLQEFLLGSYYVCRGVKPERALQHEPVKTERAQRPLALRGLPISAG